ncbi:MAG TPA: radical SAM protein [Nitrososphaerales archaeon]|nr:radical SAM protein [Nitrososphaerales archaeon]
MARYVLVSDATLSREYSNFPLMDFLPCAPSGLVPSMIYEFIKGGSLPDEGGRASVAPYALRKLESALLAQNKPEDVVVAHEDYISKFVDEKTDIIGVYTMDPLGLAPLTMSYTVLFSDQSAPWVKVEFQRLLAKVNRARAGKKAKVVVGGPGVWELTVMPEALDQLGIDYAFQGEADDIINEALEDIATSSIYHRGYFKGFQSFDGDFSRMWVSHDRFITRKQASKQFPNLEDIPLIRAPTVKGLVEVMRGCGIGCDFCEVTLRPIRYYTPEMVKREVAVNAKRGKTNAWMHSDEIFAFQHGPHFTPNPEAIRNLFETATSVEGILSSNPTHGRISIPAGYPEMMKYISEPMKAGPAHWIGVQVGLETGSERLASIHMPNKTLPLKIGPDGSWKSIVAQGVQAMNRAYWRPAFTVQVGQSDETPEDNWETVALVNRLSAMEVDGRQSEFTVTPMQNVPLGRIKSKKLSHEMLDEAQLAVYYACYRHLAKVVKRDAVRDSKGNPASKAAMFVILNMGAWGLLHTIERICVKRGVDIEKVKNYGMN